MTDIITSPRHRKCKVGCRTNSFRADDKNCDFPESDDPQILCIDPVRRRRGEAIHLYIRRIFYFYDKIAVGTIEGARNDTKGASTRRAGFADDTYTLMPRVRNLEKESRYSNVVEFHSQITRQRVISSIISVPRLRCRRLFGEKDEHSSRGKWRTFAPVNENESCDTFRVYARNRGSNPALRSNWDVEWLLVSPVYKEIESSARHTRGL